MSHNAPPKKRILILLRDSTLHVESHMSEAWCGILSEVAVPKQLSVANESPNTQCRPVFAAIQIRYNALYGSEACGIPGDMIAVQCNKQNCPSDH